MTNRELRNILRRLRAELGRCVNLCDELLGDLETEITHHRTDRLITKIEHKATVLFVLTNRALHVLGVHAAQQRRHPPHAPRP